MNDPDLLFCLGPKNTRFGGHFILSDLDTSLSSGQLVVKIEKTLPFILNMRAPIDLTLKTSESKKRKTLVPRN